MSIQPMTTPLFPSLPDLLRSAVTDHAALARLVEAEQDRMRTWLVHVLRDNDLADDALQETWLILSRGQWQFVVHSSDGDGDVRAWLRQIALRAALRLRERASTHQRILGLWRAREAEPRPVATPLEYLEEQDRGVVVWAAVSDLPSSQREAMELRFRDGLDFADIGRVQGCSALTARVRTWRGLSLVRRRLGVLGLLAMPGLVRAALSVGGWGGAQSASLSGFSAGFTGFDQRLLAGVGVVTVGFIALGTAWFARSDADSGALDRAANVESGITSHGRTDTGRPVWEWTPPAAVESTSPMTPSTEATESDVAAMSQILFEMTFFEARDLPFPSTRYSILTASETAGLLTRLANDQDTIVTSEPRVLTRAGQQAMFVNMNHRPFLAGYQRLTDGIDPVISMVDEGVQAWVSGRPEGDGILMTRAEGRSKKPLAFTRQQAVWTDRAGREQNLGWEEVTSLSTHSTALPVAGVMLSVGSSLLLPGQPGSIVRSTPAGAVPQAGSGDGTWWMLITPTAVEDSPEDSPGLQPDLPTAPVSEPSTPAILRANG